MIESELLIIRMFLVMVTLKIGQEKYLLLFLLAARKYLIALKAEVGKLDINELTNVPTSLNDLKAKVDDLDVGKLKTVPVDLKK